MKADTVIDVDVLLNRTTDFKIAEELIHVRELTLNQFEDMLDIEQMSGRDAFESQARFLSEVLSNNKEGKKFTIEDIKQLQKTAITLIWQTLAARTIEITRSKN